MKEGHDMNSYSNNNAVISSDINAGDTTMTTTNNFQTATLSSSAVLVTLSIGMWNASAKDKRKSDELTTAAGAKSGVAKVNKNLLPDCAELDAVKKIMGQARKYLYETTMVWSDDKQRLLPLAYYQEFVSVMNDFSTEFFAAVAALIPVYVTRQYDAQQALGSLYNADDYPSVHDLREHFKFVVEFEPVPESGHFVVDLHAQARKELVEKFNRTASDKVQRSFAAVCEEFKDCMEHLVSKVNDADNADKSTRIHGSLLPNIRRVIDRVRAANNIMGNNAEVTATVDAIEDALANISVEALRDNETARERVRTGVQSALSKFNF
jgi:hypothetical protein